jgi:hypothetical protein
LRAISAFKFCRLKPALAHTFERYQIIKIF